MVTGLSQHQLGNPNSLQSTKSKQIKRKMIKEKKEKSRIHLQSFSYSRAPRPIGLIKVKCILF